MHACMCQADNGCANFLHPDERCTAVAEELNSADPENGCASSTKADCVGCKKRVTPLSPTVAVPNIARRATIICGENTQDCSAISRQFSHHILTQVVQFLVGNGKEPQKSIHACMKRSPLLSEFWATGWRLHTGR
jgi:hypothetical protein